MPRPKGSKNKPGAGRPKMSRTVNLPRITVEAHSLLKSHADRTGKGIAGAIEEAAKMLNAIGPDAYKIEGGKGWSVEIVPDLTPLHCLKMHPIATPESTSTKPAFAAKCLNH